MNTSNQSLIINFQGQSKALPGENNSFHFSGDEQNHVKVSVEHFFGLMNAFDQVVGIASFDNSKQQLISTITHTTNREELEQELHKWLQYSDLVRTIKELQTFPQEATRKHETEK